MTGGTKGTSSNTYLKYYAHFIKIILALGHNPFPIPVPRDLILLYLANNLLQPKPNIYDTCRYKMRALDWVNQNCGYHTSWSHDGFIVPMMNYIKQHHPSLGAKLIPLLLKDILLLIQFCMDKFNDLFMWEVLRYEWYFFMIYCIISYSCALRVGEIVHPNKDKDKDYGIRFCDFKFGYKKDIYNENEKISIDEYNFKRRDELFCIQITLQNSKTRNWNKTDVVYIGTTKNLKNPSQTKAKYNPLYMVFDAINTLKGAAKKYPLHFYFNMKSKYHFFQNSSKSGFFKKAWVSKKLKLVFKSIGYENWKQVAPHSFRKGFNSYLYSIGIPPQKIANAGRWYLYAAFYRYTIIPRSDMISMTRVCWEESKCNISVKDWDYCLHLFQNDKTKAIQE